MVQWYRPKKAVKEIENSARLMATLTVIAVTLSIVAIIFAMGSVKDAA